MNVKILTLVIVLLVSLLCSASAGNFLSKSKTFKDITILHSSYSTTVVGHQCPPQVIFQGPLASTEQSKDMEEGGSVRKLVQHSAARGGQSHRPAGWKRRRPRPRLSHKGPMPF